MILESRPAQRYHYPKRLNFLHIIGEHQSCRNCSARYTVSGEEVYFYSHGYHILRTGGDYYSTFHAGDTAERPLTCTENMIKQVIE